MGKIKIKVKKVLDNSPVFTNRDVSMITKDKSYTNLLLHNLVKSKEAYRLKRGCYSWTQDPFLSVFCFRPAYLGLEFALSFYEIWDQETNPVIITPKKVRGGTRKVLGTNIVVHRIKQEYFFGINFLKHDEFYLPISDIEKTVLDFIYFNALPAEDVWNNLLDRVNEKKISSYIKNYPKKQQVEMRNKIEI